MNAAPEQMRPLLLRCGARSTGDMVDQRYVAEAAIGEGGFGKVRKGYDSALKRSVAIKSLDPVWGKADEKDKERFRREAQTLAQLSHPHIPAIYDVVFTEDSFQIIFQFIDGKSMRDILHEQKAIGLANARLWFSQIASALQHAHDSHIVHRDVKPENMVVALDERHCYLVDFGIALSTEEQRRLTSGVIGTPGYMSPEHEDGKAVDPSDDVYVLGVCLYEALIGHRIAAGQYEALNDKNEAIPPQIDELVQDCIAPKGGRIQSASEFGRRLAAAFHVGAPLSTILVDGQLHQIIEAIRNFTPEEFMSLPDGQRLLIIERTKDLIEAGDRMHLARMEFLTVLPTLALHIDSEEYREIVVAALKDGFEHESRSGYVGDRQIRSSLEEAAKRVGGQNHRVVVEALIAWLENHDIESQEAWVYHSLRGLLQVLMANVACTRDSAISLANLLKQVNRLQRRRAAEGSSSGPEVLRRRQRSVDTVDD